MAIRFWGQDRDFGQILGGLLGTGLRISDQFGGYPTYLAIIAHELGFEAWVKCSLGKNLPELSEVIDSKRRRSLITLAELERGRLSTISRECAHSNYPRSYLYKSLALLRSKTDSRHFQIYAVSGRPSIEDVYHFIKRGIPVMVNVRCDEYYCLPSDDSGHFLTFIPVSDNENGYIILDGYRDRGRKLIPHWGTYLAKAASYDWRTWSNWLVAIKPDLQQLEC
jgi:hypothetical protein